MAVESGVEYKMNLHILHLHMYATTQNESSHFALTQEHKMNLYIFAETLFIINVSIFPAVFELLLTSQGIDSPEPLKEWAVLDIAKNISSDVLVGEWSCCGNA